MKKLLKALIITLLLCGCFGCKGEEANTDPQPTPQPAPSGDQQDKNEIALDEVIELLTGNGEWHCPLQYYDIILMFGTDQGKYLVDMAVYDSENIKDTVAEITKATYDPKSETYTLKLAYYDTELPISELHVNTSEIKEGFIRAENIYDENRIVEYIFVTHEDPDGPEGAPQLSYSRWEKDDQDVLPEYTPYVEFDPAGAFVFVENVYEGMIEIRGGYRILENGYECTLEDPDVLQGFTPERVTTIVFEKISDSEMILKTELCYSRSGSIFRSVPLG